MQKIGKLNNRWRRRVVDVYKTYKDCMVLTVGYPYDGGDPVVCFEHVNLWENVIAQYPKTVIYN